MSATSGTPITSTAKASEAPAAAHTGEEAVVASPSSSNEQAKEDKEDKEGEKSDNDQEEQKSAGIFPCVSEERDGGFLALATISGIPLCSPYPSEEQIRRRYEEIVESAEKLAKAAAASPSEEQDQDHESGNPGGPLPVNNPACGTVQQRQEKERCAG